MESESPTTRTHPYSLIPFIVHYCSGYPRRLWNYPPLSLLELHTYPRLSKHLNIQRSFASYVSGPPLTLEVLSAPPFTSAYLYHRQSHTLLHVDRAYTPHSPSCPRYHRSSLLVPSELLRFSLTGDTDPGMGRDPTVLTERIVKHLSNYVSGFAGGSVMSPDVVTCRSDERYRQVVRKLHGQDTRGVIGIGGITTPWDWDDGEERA